MAPNADGKQKHIIKIKFFFVSSLLHLFVNYRVCWTWSFCNDGIMKHISQLELFNDGNNNQNKVSGHYMVMSVCYLDYLGYQNFTTMQTM